MTATIRALDERDREMLKSLTAGIFLDGECYAFAIAMHRNTGWPMTGLIEHGTIRHAGVEAPGGLLYDARGPVPPEKFGEPFSIRFPYQRQVISEKDLTAIRPVSERSIKSAGRFAAALWPEIPWQRGFHKQALAFARDLERISRKHGLWIRGPYATCQPILEEELGGEEGYSVCPTADGLSYTIDRTLARRY